MNTCDILLQILDRKNNEIEVLKTLYKTKQCESEETIRRLDKKGDEAWKQYSGLSGIMFFPTCTKRTHVCINS